MSFWKTFFGRGQDESQPPSGDGGERSSAGVETSPPSPSDHSGEPASANMAEDVVIVSPDTRRPNRLPPGQVQTKRWPVLHAGSVPNVNTENWNLRFFGLVDTEWSCTFADFLALPRIKVKGDFHCVTSWSLLDNLWEGVSVLEIMKRVKLKPEAQFVLVYAEKDWTTNLPLSDFLQEDCLFAIKNNGQELTPEHGYPVRLIVPRLYAWKSAKWVRGIEFLEKDKAGFWESGGYHMRGDPWQEERYRWS